MAAKWVKKTFHISVFLAFFYALYYYELLNEIRRRLITDNKWYFGNLKYLTYWNVVAQFLMFASLTATDFLDLNSKWYIKISKFTNSLVTGVGVPYALFVTSTFWSLYFIDRELIFPKHLEKYYPVWLNHLSHTLILPFILIECNLRHYVWRRWHSLQVCLLFGGCYIAWMFYLGITYNIWVYPFMMQFNMVQRVLYLAVSAAGAVMLYFIGEQLDSFIWGKKKMNVRKPRF